MSDPSSFAETPLAQLRKLIEQMRTEQVYWRYADKLSATLTDLEAAPPLNTLIDEMLVLEDRVCIDQRVPEDVAVAISSFSHRFEALRSGEAAASRPADLTQQANREFLEAIVREHGANDHTWLVRCARDILAQWPAVSPAVEGGREDQDTVQPRADDSTQRLNQRRMGQ